MLPVAVTVIVIRIIFKLKLADIIITVTSGGPGGATDSVTSFIYREYRDRSNVGYGTLLAMVYLVLIVIVVTLLLALFNRLLRRSRTGSANDRRRSATAAAPRLLRLARRDLRRRWRSGRFVCLFPIYWTVTTSFKTAPDVTQGHLVPFVDYQPDWRGWRSLGLSPDTIARDLDPARRSSSSASGTASSSRSAPRCSRSSSARSPPTASAASATASPGCATRTSRSSSSAS